MNYPGSIKRVAGMIEHSLLNPAITDEEFMRGCRLAVKYETAAVCVNSCAVAQARRLLESSNVAICSVVSFPHGSSTAEVKLEETRRAIADGATELDMVINIGKVLSGDWDYVTEEIRVINTAATDGNAILKVIFENAYLTDPQIVRLCRICSELRVAFVRTSTGFGFSRLIDGSFSCLGATDHHIRLMREHCGQELKIKASGGIRTLKDLLRMRQLGAARIGTSSTLKIIEEARRLEMF